MHKHERLQHVFRGKPLPRLVSQIHDELVYEVAGGVPGGVAVFAAFLREIMEDRVREQLGFGVPLAVKLEVGRLWGGMVPYEVPRQFES